MQNGPSVDGATVMNAAGLMVIVPGLLAVFLHLRTAARTAAAARSTTHSEKNKFHRKLNQVEDVFSSHSTVADCEELYSVVLDLPSNLYECHDCVDCTPEQGHHRFCIREMDVNEKIEFLVTNAGWTKGYNEIVNLDELETISSRLAELCQGTVGPLLQKIMQLDPSEACVRDATSVRDATTTTIETGPGGSSAHTTDCISSTPPATRLRSFFTSYVHQYNYQNYHFGRRVKSSLSLQMGRRIERTPAVLYPLEIYHEIDMKNCWPSLLLYISYDWLHLRPNQVPTLQRYVLHPKLVQMEVLTEQGIVECFPYVSVKITILKIMFGYSGHCTQDDSGTVLNRLHEECDLIRTTLWSRLMQQAQPSGTTVADVPVVDQKWTDMFHAVLQSMNSHHFVGYPGHPSNSFSEWMLNSFTNQYLEILLTYACTSIVENFVISLVERFLEFPLHKNIYKYRVAMLNYDSAMLVRSETSHGTHLIDENSTSSLLPTLDCEPDPLNQLLLHLNTHLQTVIGYEFISFQSKSYGRKDSALSLLKSPDLTECPQEIVDMTGYPRNL